MMCAMKSCTSYLQCGLQISWHDKSLQVPRWLHCHLKWCALYISTENACRLMDVFLTRYIEIFSRIWRCSCSNHNYNTCCHPFWNTNISRCLFLRCLSTLYYIWPYYFLPIYAGTKLSSLKWWAKSKLFESRNIWINIKQMILYNYL